MSMGSRTAEIDKALSTMSCMHDEDRLWSYYSNDKADIGLRLGAVIRRIHKEVPLQRKLRALSLGSSNEPQFRILSSMFHGGLYLVDIDTNALDSVRERIMRQKSDHVNLVAGNYRTLLHDKKTTSAFLQDQLDGTKMDLVALHHSLYYSPAGEWPSLFELLYGNLLRSKGGIHAVLMASSSNNTCSTTWLYNHFAGKFFGVHNTQSLPGLKQRLASLPLFRNAELKLYSSKVAFHVDDFAKFMNVIWMVLLYPDVHQYSESQLEEITGFMYDRIWSKGLALEQHQHHLVIFHP